MNKDRLIPDGPGYAAAPQWLVDAADRQAFVVTPVINLIPNCVIPQLPKRGQPNYELLRAVFAAQIREYGPDAVPARQWCEELDIDVNNLEFAETSRRRSFDLPDFNPQPDKGKSNRNISNRAENNPVTSGELDRTAWKLDQENAFDAENDEDARGKILRSIALRQGQPQFRRDVLDAYGGRCAITRCDIEPAIQAAHIKPYLGEHTNHVTNGLPLRADVHVLMDRGLIAIHPDTLEVKLAPQVLGSDYAQYEGLPIRLPEDKARAPNKEALRQRWEEFDAE